MYFSYGNKLIADWSFTIPKIDVFYPINRALETETGCSKFAQIELVICVQLESVYA